jgi:hypothetical protein
MGGLWENQLMGNFMSHKWEGLQAALDMVDSAKAKRGITTGLRKVGDKTKTVASTAIREVYNMKKGDVDKTFSIYATDQSVIITSKGRPINLTAFNAKQFGSHGGKRVTTQRKGDSIQSKRRGKAGTFGGVAVGITNANTTLLYGGFIAKVAAGNKGASNIGVFMRANHAMTKAYHNPYQRKTGRAYVKVVRSQVAYRQAIINKAFVSVPSLFTGQRVMDKIFEYINGDAIKTVMGEILWATTGKRS